MTRYLIDPDASTVWIEGSSSLHPIKAQATGLTGWVELSREQGPVRAELEISVDRLRSGNPLVDRETRRRIDAGRHPSITGSITDSSTDDAGHHTITGDLSFRGEVRSVTGQVTATVEDGHLEIEGEQTFDVRDWGLRLPRLGLLRVHPDVQVRIAISADVEG